MSDQQEGERLAASERHPSRNSRSRPQLVLVQGGAEPLAEVLEPGGRLRRTLHSIGAFLVEGAAFLPDHYLH